MIPKNGNWFSDKIMLERAPMRCGSFPRARRRRRYTYKERSRPGRSAIARTALRRRNVLRVQDADAARGVARELASLKGRVATVIELGRPEAEGALTVAGPCGERGGHGSREQADGK